MNLSNLKPAWLRFKSLSSMQRYDQEEILAMLGKAEGVVISKTDRSLVTMILFIVLTICCQGG